MKEHNKRARRMVKKYREQTWNLGYLAWFEEKLLSILEQHISRGVERLIRDTLREIQYLLGLKFGVEESAARLAEVAPAFARART